MTTISDKKTPLSPQKSEPGTHIANKHRFISSSATTLVTAIIALGCALYAITTNLQLRNSTEQTIQRLDNQIAAFKQQHLAMTTQYETAIKVIHKSQDKLQSKLNMVDKNLQSALQQRLYQSNDWLLQKARYYLEMAQINAQWSDNLKTTAALLQQADVLLASIHDQRLFNIRQEIAKELAEIQAIPTPDIAGLLSQLDAAIELIPNLPLKAAIDQIDKKNTTTTNKESSSTWRERLRESVGLLENLVVIRHHDEDILPLASPAYESMLREGIRLNLQEAQWAVLQNNDPVYQFSLAAALKNIGRVFPPNDPTNSLIQRLQTLQKTHLTQQQPMIERSLPLLNQLIEANNTPTNDVKPTMTGESSK